MWSRFCVRPGFELIASARPSGGAGRSWPAKLQPISQNPATGAESTAGASMPVTSVEGTSSQAKGFFGSSSLMSTKPRPGSVTAQGSPCPGSARQDAHLRGRARRTSAPAPRRAAAQAARTRTTARKARAALTARPAGSG